MARFNTIQYITIASTGNAADFGDLSTVAYRMGQCSSPTRGLVGMVGNGVASNIIEYVTIASTGNSTDFGDLTQSRRSGTGFSSDTRGCFAAGELGNGSGTNTVDYDTESYVLERFGATVLSYALGGPAGAAAVNLVWQIVSSYSDSQSELMALCMGDLLNSLDCD